MNAQRLIQQSIWYLRQWRQYAGILAIAGLVLLLMAGALYVQKLKPIQKDLERRELSLLEAARKLKQSASSASATASSVAERLPQSNQFTAFLLKLNELAEQKHIVLQQSDYKATPEVGGELLRYGLQFPANGTYPDTQQFIAELEKMPGVRIENINLSRPQIGEAMLSIQVQMSYLSEVQP
jgi:HPt (histidine-containing phosphotransfer) domain-containing protein